MQNRVKYYKDMFLLGSGIENEIKIYGIETPKNRSLIDNEEIKGEISTALFFNNQKLCFLQIKMYDKGQGKPFKEGKSYEYAFKKGSEIMNLGRIQLQKKIVTKGEIDLVEYYFVSTNKS